MPTSSPAQQQTKLVVRPAPARLAKAVHLPADACCQTFLLAVMKMLCRLRNATLAFSA